MSAPEQIVDESPRVADPSSPDRAAGSCPKCGLTRGDAVACPRCGLSFAKLKAGRARLPAGSMGRGGNPAMRAHLEARWLEIASQLDDTKTHRAFIQLCAQHGMLAFAGQRYRDLTAPGAPESDRVKALRERVLQAAIASMGRPARAQPRATLDRRRSLILLSAGALLMLALAVGYYLASNAMTGLGAL